MTEKPKLEFYPKQKAFHLSKKSIRSFIAGVSSGKSLVGAADLLLRAKRGRTYMVIGPTYPNLRDSSMRSLLDVAEMLDLIDTKHLKRSPPPELKTRSGADILFRSADKPDRLRGPNLSGVWLDEASLMKSEVVNIALGRLREGGELGWLSATLTPKGQSHWTYDRFGKPNPDTFTVRARTAENPFTDPKFLSLLQRHYVGDFALQELEGEFVDEEGVSQVLPSAWVRLAQMRWTPERPEGLTLACVGADVSRGGADATCVAARYGNWFAPIKRHRGEITDDGPKAAFLVLQEHDSSSPINVDVTGIGSACYDALKAKIGRLANPVNFSGGSKMLDRTRKYKMTNVRAAMYWTLREALDPENGDELALPPSGELYADLCAARFEIRASGIKVEEKAEIKKRLGRSPDLADAVALALWDGRGTRLQAHVLGGDNDFDSPTPDDEKKRAEQTAAKNDEQLKRWLAGVDEDLGEDDWRPFGSGYGPR